MAYCRKCGAQLEEGERFCHVCGTPVSAAQPTPQPQMRRRRAFPLAAWILIAIVGAAVIFGTLFFLPVVPVSANDYREIPKIPGVHTLNMGLTADIAEINVTFANLPDQLVTLNVTMNGKAGLWYSPGMLNVTFDNSTSDGVLTVTSDAVTTFGFLKPFSLNLLCDLRIDASLASSLKLKTVVGRIDLAAPNSGRIRSLDLTATTGLINVKMPTNGRLDGNVSLATTTGTIELSWQNVTVNTNVFVTATTTTGTVTSTISQNDRLLGNVVMTGQTTTGSVNFDLTIANGIGAYIQSSVTTGSINVNEQTGFTGNKTSLQSTNYPALHNFNATLRSTTGSVDLNARYNA